MSHWYLWVGFAGLTLAACSAAPDRSEDPSRASSDRPKAGAALASDVDGQRQSTNVTRLYEVTCAKCHGDRGQGGGGGTKSLNTKEKFEQAHDKPFFDAIKKGVPDMGMEAYGETLSDEAIWALVVHIRELQRDALRAEFGDPKAVDGVYKSQRANFRIETVIDTGKGLKTPWSIDWLTDGQMLVTNRGGQMFSYIDGKMTPISGLPPSIEQGQGGLMEVSVHPDYAKNGWIYLSIADPAKDGNGAMTKIVRGKIRFKTDSAEWVEQQTIYEADQKYYSRAGIHFGSKIVFDGKGHVYFSVGERGTNMGAQDTTTPFGKVMRVREDGTIPADNPFPNNPMWSYGHRNQQGLSFDAEGNLWDTEHGPRGGDELNLIQKGANYGWPVVAFSINYNDSPYRLPWPKEEQKITMPVFRWLPSCAASGLDLARGPAFPSWGGDLLAGGLAGQNLDRIRVKGGKLVEREELIHGMGRIRDVAVAKDGTVYIALNEPDKIIRLIPAG